MIRYIPLLIAFGWCADAQTRHKTENVVLVMTDGLRWQEVFHGAEAALMTDQSHEMAAGEREALLPFFWQVIAKNGQIYGNRALLGQVFFDVRRLNSLRIGRRDSHHESITRGAAVRVLVSMASILAGKNAWDSRQGSTTPGDGSDHNGSEPWRGRVASDGCHFLAGIGAEKN